MPIIRKEVLAPGVVFVEDSNGNPMPVEFTRKHIDHYYDSGKRMLRMGLMVPVPFEHQDFSLMTAAERRAAQLRDNAGEVKDFVRVGGKLFADLEVSDQTAAKFGKTIKYVSPDIERRVVDGKGNVWENVITHVALTNRPRWMDQEPFKGNDGAALMEKLTAGKELVPTKFSLSLGNIRLSMAAAVRKDGKGWTMADPNALKKVKLSDEPDDKKDDEAPAKGETGKEPESAEEPVQTPSEFADAGGNKSAGLANLVEKLLQLGVKVPDDTSPDNMIERLNVAIDAYLHAKVHHGIEDPKQNDDAGAMAATDGQYGAGPVTEEPHTMLMSLAKNDNAGMAALAKAAIKSAKSGYQAKIATLKKLGTDPAVIKELDAECEPASMRLSLNAEGDVQHGAFDKKLDQMIRLAQSKGLTQRLSLSVESGTAKVVPHPTDAEMMAQQKPDESMMALCE